MKLFTKSSFWFGVFSFFVFVCWTVAVTLYDVKKLGPLDVSVGFATTNSSFHSFTGVNMLLYNITDWLSLVVFCVVVGFFVLGLLQWINRKSILKVDYSILVLGAFYIVVLMIYMYFEVFVINYRPILINGVLEPSYPSSTTMLVMCVMPTAIMQFNERINNTLLKRSVTLIICVFTLFMVIARLISGVHWLTDIVGGAILSLSLVSIYFSIAYDRTKFYE